MQINYESIILEENSYFLLRKFIRERKSYILVNLILWNPDTKKSKSHLLYAHQILHVLEVLQQYYNPVSSDAT